MVTALAARQTAMMICLTSALFAQQDGSLQGTVRDKEQNAPVAGAQVTIVETGQKTVTSEQGGYVFPKVKPGDYTLVVGKDSYSRQVRPGVHVVEGRLTEADFALEGDVTELDELLVQDILQTSNVTELDLLRLRFRSPALLDSISSDQMSRAGASDASSALRLVPGATVQKGKTAVIRGLPDRYVSSQMNGVRLPSADEDKRAVELDQFPASVIDSIQVSKTFTPDQQGDASGGAVNLQLKSIPSEPFFVRLYSQASYNPQVSHRSDFLSYEGGGLHSGGRGVQPVGQDWTGAVGASPRDSPADYKVAAATGGRFEIDDGVRLGVMASVFDERSNSFFNNGRDDSYWVEHPGAPMTPHTYQGTVPQGDFKTALYDITRSKQTQRTGGLATIGLESEHHLVALTYLYSRVAEDAATLAVDTRGKQYFFPGYDPNNPNTPGHNEPNAAPYLRLETLDYTERTTSTLQLHGRHSAEKDPQGNDIGPVIDWTIAKSTAGLDEPDKRQFAEFWEPGHQVGPFTVPAFHGPYKPGQNFTLGNLQRTFKSIDEDSDQYFVDVKLPFEQWNGEKCYFKFGTFHDRVVRQFNQDSFSNFDDPNGSFQAPFEIPWSSHFPQEHHPITASEFDVDYTGLQEIDAYYGMADLVLFSGFDVIGGARVETTRLAVTNHPEQFATWFPPGSVTLTELHPGDADFDNSQTDVLPSIGCVWRPAEPVALRLSYNGTVAHQTFKEVTPILQQEYIGGPTFVGNPQLKMSAIKNYDARLEYAPYPGGLVSGSWFYKDIDRPIEYVQRVATFDYTTAVNYPSGRLQGWEFEARQKLGEFAAPLEGIAVGGNLTIIHSQVTLPEDEAAGFHDLNIQAPMNVRNMTNAPNHLYNLFLTYDIEATGTQFGAFYTVTGDTLVAGAGESLGNFVPSIYARQYDNLNLSLTQRLGKYVTLSLAAKNLTNPAITEVYRSPYIGSDVLKTSYTRGTEYVLGIGGTMTF
jgi:outer membrane receptor protein involved in Fe transport